MEQLGTGARLKNFLRSDIAMVAFLLTAVTAAYSLGGVPSLTLIILVIAILAVFVSLAKGPDVLIVYSVFALFFTALAFVAGHVTGLVISLVVTVFLASRGIVNIKLNRNSIATLAAMIAAISLAYVLLPGYYPLLVTGAASIALFGLLVWAGKISPYTLKLVFLRPSEGFQVLRMKVRATWEQATQALEQQPSVEESEVRRLTAEGEGTGHIGEETVSREIVDEGRKLMVSRYLNFLQSLELAYKEGRIKQEVYERLKSEYLGRLKELGYDITKLEQQG
jgi:signal transduction histidine kinase